MTPVSPKLRLFTVFSPTPTPDSSSNARKSVDSSTALAMLDAAPVKQFASDFILISEVLRAPARVQVESYETTSNAQILYQRARWQLLEEGSNHETVPFLWTRFQAVSNANTTTCLGVAQWDASWNDSDAGDATSQHVASLLANVNANCKPGDTVALALTSPAASMALAHLQATSALNANTTTASKGMVEATSLLHKQQYVSSSVAVLDIPSAASSRLFLRLGDSMCADRAATLSGVKGGAVAWDALALELCIGSSCSICKPTNFTTTNGDNEPSTSTSGASQQTVVVLVCCGLFIVASVPVIFVLFRHQFYSPDETTKEETELTTNLAYVLRI